MKHSVLVPGTVLRKRYIIEGTVGIGGFGITYRARDPVLDVTVAIKEYSRGSEKFLREARITARFRSCRNIVYVYDFFETEEAAYIVMEYMEGETLKNRIEREGGISSKEAVRIMIPVLKAMETIHRAGVLHRDIAPDNIFLLKSGKIKLFDFGSSGESGESFRYAEVKNGYSPPEQYYRNVRQGTAGDIYAAGATLYRMLTNRIPPAATERTERPALSFDRSGRQRADRHLAAVIMKAMQPDPGKRYKSAYAFRVELEKYAGSERTYTGAVLLVCVAVIGAALLVKKVIVRPAVYADTRTYADKETYVDTETYAGTENPEETITEPPMTETAVQTTEETTKETTEQTTEETTEQITEETTEETTEIPGEQTTEDYVEVHTEQTTGESVKVPIIHQTETNAEAFVIPDLM